MEPVAPDASAASTDDTRSLIEHTVGEDESLEKIAQAYGVSIDNLKRWNALSSDALAAGDRKSTRLNSSHIQKSRMPSSA